MLVKESSSDSLDFKGETKNNNETTCRFIYTQMVQSAREMQPKTQKRMSE